MAARHTAHMLDLPEPPDQWIASNFSVPFARHMELLFPHNTEEATRHYMEYYHSRVKELGGLFDDVTEMLEALKIRGYLVALLSDKRRMYGEGELDSVGIRHLFDYVLFLGDGRAYKPNPQGLEQVMDALSVTKGNVLYVGDSHVDMQCARRAGTSGGAALWGAVNVEAVLKEAPDFVWHSVTEVLTTLTPEMTEH